MTLGNGCSSRKRTATLPLEPAGSRKPARTSWRASARRETTQSRRVRSIAPPITHLRPTRLRNRAAGERPWPRGDRDGWFVRPRTADLPGELRSRACPRRLRSSGLVRSLPSTRADCSSDCRALESCTRTTWRGWFKGPGGCRDASSGSRRRWVESSERSSHRLVSRKAASARTASDRRSLAPARHPKQVSPGYS